MTPCATAVHGVAVAEDKRAAGLTPEYIKETIEEVYESIVYLKGMVITDKDWPYNYFDNLIDNLYKLKQLDHDNYPDPDWATNGPPPKRHKGA